MHDWLKGAKQDTGHLDICFQTAEQDLKWQI